MTPNLFSQLAVLLLVFCWQSILVAANRRTSLSSTGYHDPYKFAYAVKKPLPFHGNFGQSLITDAGLPSFGNGVFGDASSSASSISTSRDTSKASRSVSNSATYPLDDETLIASVDETSFGDRIVPRGAAGKQLKRAPKPQSNQQLGSNQPANIIEKRPEPFKEVNQFFVNIPQVKPVTETNGNIKPSPQVDQISALNVESSVFPKETSKWIKNQESSPEKANGNIQSFLQGKPSSAIGPEQQAENSRGVRDFAESIQNQFFSFPSPSDNPFNNINQEFKNIESSSPSSFAIPESSLPGLSYSYFVLGSSSKPESGDTLKIQPVPPVQSESTGQVVKSPGIFTSEIDQSYAQYSPFSQQEGLKSSSSLPTAAPENTAERPFTSNEPVSKSPLSSAPFIQPVSSNPPAFIPSPPVLRNEISPRYPQPPPVRVLEPPQPISSAPALKANFPEPNKYAGFIPPPPRETSGTFSEYPKPNFSAFYPPPSTETVYYGGYPDEPPSKLKGSVVSFIKNAVNTNEMKAPFEPQYPNSNTFASQSPFKSTPSSHLNVLSNENDWQKPAGPPVQNNQPIHQQFSNSGATVTKSNSPTQSNPVRPATQNSAKPPGSPQPVLSLSVPAPPPASSWNIPAPTKPLVTSNVPFNPKPPTNPSLPTYSTSPAPVRPTSSPTVLSAPKPPTGLVPSPVITKPLNLAVPATQVTPIRYSQPIGQPPQLSTANKNTIPSASGGFKPPSSSEFLPFVPSRPVPPIPSRPVVQSLPPRPVAQSLPSRPGVPASPSRPSLSTPINQFPVKRAPPVYSSQQIRQVYSTLTKNPAPVQVLAPVPIYLTAASLSLPRAGRRSSVHSYPEQQPYQFVVTYG